MVVTEAKGERAQSSKFKVQNLSSGWHLLPVQAWRLN
jgi:hypothetical protein